MDSYLYDIWMSGSDAFNRWRKENDLKLLFTYFIDHSKSFARWMMTFGLSLEDILEINPSREVLLGNSLKRYVAFKGNDGNKKVIITESKMILSDKLEVIKNIDYEPFLYWKKRNEPDEPFIINSNGVEYNSKGNVDNLNDSYIKRNKANLKTGKAVNLFGEFNLLSIESLCIASDIELINRNLDFIGFNNITICNNELPYNNIDTCFSCINNLNLVNVKASNFKIHHSLCSRIKIENSSLANLLIHKSFIKDSFYGIYLDKSKIKNLIFEDVAVQNIIVCDSTINDLRLAPMSTENSNINIRFARSFIGEET